MRYFTYISDSKLEMLFDQIPPKILSRIVAELKIDLKVVSLSLRQQETQATRFGKLEVVEKFLEHDQIITGPTEPGVWFHGGMPLRAGVVGGMQRSGLAYFAGRSDDTLVALIGSSKHLLGRVEAPEISVSYSTTPALVDVLGEEQEPGGSIGRHLSDEDRILYEIKDFTHNLRGLREPHEFLARRLMVGQTVDERGPLQVVLGTPLYVARADT